MKNLKWIGLLLAVPAIAMLFTGCKCEDEEFIIPVPVIDDAPVLFGSEDENLTIGELIELSDNQIVAYLNYYQKLVYLNPDYQEIVREQFNAIEEGPYWILPAESGSTDIQPYTLLPFEEIKLDVEVHEDDLLSVKGYTCDLREPSECALLVHRQKYYSPKSRISVCTQKEGAVCSFIWKDTPVTIYKDADCTEVERETTIKLARCIL